MSDIIPIIFADDQAKKKVDFVNDYMKVALLSGTFNECVLETITSFDEISSNEIPAQFGYTQGGFIVGGKTVHIDTLEYAVVYDMNDVGMTVSGGTLGPVRYGVLYDLDNDNHLVYIFDFGEDKTVNDGAQFKIKIDDKGLMWGAPRTSTCTDSSNGNCDSC